MRQLALVLVSTLLTLSPAEAATYAIKFSNKTGVVINTITATPKPSGAAISVSATAIAANAEPKLIITTPDTNCLVSMVYTLSSGRIITNAEVDLCQTDMIVVE